MLPLRLNLKVSKYDSFTESLATSNLTACKAVFCGSPHEPFKTGFSVTHDSLMGLIDANPIGFRDKMFWELISVVDLELG